jgi:outer membrane protein
MKFESRIPIMLLFLTFLVLTGCGFTPEYSAPGIRAEYSGASGFSAPPTPHTKQYDSSARSLSAETYIELNDPLTLSRVIDVSIANNPNLQQAVYRIAQAKAMRDLSSAAFWPVIGFYTEYTQGDAPSAYLFKTIDQRRLPQQINFNDPGWFENYESGITARVNLFNGGRDYLAYRVAEQDTHISDLERQTVVNALVAQIIAAFYDVLSAREFIRIAEASVASVSEQLRLIQAQYEGGAALKTDVLTLKVRLAQEQELLIESRNHYQLAHTALAHLMGVDPEQLPKDLDSVDQTSGEGIAVPATYEEGLVHALAHRPELEKIRTLLVKSRMGLEESKSYYLPRMDLMGKYYVDDPHMDYDRNRENWTAAVIFNWDLFTGFSTRARITKADAVVKEMLAADREATLGVARDVKNAYLNREAARARYDVAAGSVQNAEESYRLVKEYYNRGTVTITRYLEAEVAYNRARIRSTVAFYDKIKATAEIARAIGRLADGKQQNPER